MNPVRGFRACAVLWLAGAVSFPLVNALPAFGAEQLLLWRGVSMALPLLVVLGPTEFRTRDNAMFFAALSGAVGGLATFMCSRSLGVGRSMLMGATVPLFVAFIGFFSGRKITRSVLASMVVVVLGIVLLASARGGSGIKGAETAGFLWGALTAVSVACHWEFMGRTTASLTMRVFWIGMAGICVGGGAHACSVGMPDVATTRHYALLFLFCVLNGPVRFWAIGHMTMNLQAEITSTLASGEIVLTVLAASWMLGEQLGVQERWGALLVLVGSLAVSNFVRRANS